MKQTIHRASYFQGPSTAWRVSEPPSFPWPSGAPRVDGHMGVPSPTDGHVGCFLSGAAVHPRPGAHLGPFVSVSVSLGDARRGGIARSGSSSAFNFLINSWTVCHRAAPSRTPTGHEQRYSLSATIQHMTFKPLTSLKKPEWSPQDATPRCAREAPALPATPPAPPPRPAPGGLSPAQLTRPRGPLGGGPGHP